MKKYILITCLSLITFLTYSQKETSKETKMSATVTRQQKSELKKAEKEAALTKMEELLLSRNYILEISFMNDPSRNLLNTTAWIDVNVSVNYVAVRANKMVLQFDANNYQTANWYFGNSPLNGTFSRYDVQKLKKPDEGFTVRFHTEGQVGSYDINMSVSVSGKTDLRMMQNNGVGLTLRGVLVPSNQSRIRPVFT
jgi:hypothetical protein